MKKFLLVFTLLCFPLFAQAITINFKDTKAEFVIGERRAVIFINGTKYICEFVENTPEEIDYDGLVYEAGTYFCGKRHIFAMKHYKNTDVYQLRLYDVKTDKYLYDNRILKSQFRTISKA